MTVRIKDEIVKKEMKEGNYKCLPYILEGLDASDEVAEVIRHVMAIYSSSYADTGVPKTEEEILDIVLEELNMPPIVRGVIKSSLFDGSLSTIGKFYCSKIRADFRVPEGVCQTCKVYYLSSYSSPKDVIQHVIRSIRDVVTDGENVVIYLASEKIGGVSIPVKYRHADIIRFALIDEKNWDKRGRPAVEASRLFALVTGVIPLADIRNIDAKPLWEDVVRRMKLEVEDPSEVVRIIIDTVLDAIPEDLNRIDPNNNLITPSLLLFFAEKGELFSPKFVVRERAGMLRLWIYGKHLQSVLALSLGREIEGRLLRSIILDLGGKTSAKLGIGPQDIKGRRGYDIPVVAFPKDVQEKIEEYYRKAEELGQTKLKILRGEKSG